VNDLSLSEHLVLAVERDNKPEIHTLNGAVNFEKDAL
jgi:hypothetical protein